MPAVVATTIGEGDGLRSDPVVGLGGVVECEEVGAVDGDGVGDDFADSVAADRREGVGETVAVAVDSASVADTVDDSVLVADADPDSVAE